MLCKRESTKNRKLGFLVFDWLEPAVLSAMASAPEPLGEAPSPAGEAPSPATGRELFPEESGSPELKKPRQDPGGCLGDVRLSSAGWFG